MTPGIPHARGGGPLSIVYVPAGIEVFPTHVGVDRQIAVTWSPSPQYSPRTWGWTARSPSPGRLAPSIPHARGGGPNIRKAYDPIYAYSPRTWGWTELAQADGQDAGSIPHARGGGPYEMRASIV